MKTATPWSALVIAIGVEKLVGLDPSWIGVYVPSDETRITFAVYVGPGFAIR